MIYRSIAALIVGVGLSGPLMAQDGDPSDPYAEVRSAFEDARKATPVPGSVFGVVKDGKLALVEATGVRDLATGIPVDADTRFRIASMSKAFTALAILHLRDRGRIDLDAPASRYVPQMKRWKLPTGDARAITVRDLLHHSGGFVEDNPWGDRQQVLPEAEFSALISGGMDFASTPGTRYEYSNYGYALLGRIVSRVSGKRYQDYIRDTIMRPLGMDSTGFEIGDSPVAERAIGYRWQDGAWVREPDMRDGAFGAMGGVETTAKDYAKWMAFLLAAWPADDRPDTGPVRRSTVRDMVSLAMPMPPMERAAEVGPPCRQSAAYGAGLRVLHDCDLGRVVTHGGGYPGYGSNMAFLPDAGVGSFVFNSRTYTGFGGANLKALRSLRVAGAIPDRAAPVSPGLAQAYRFAKDAWSSGSLQGLPLAGNVALDKDLPRRAREIAEIKGLVGACSMSESIAPVSAMEGRFQWDCEKGVVVGRVQRAPTARLELQVIEFGGGPRSRP